MPEEIEEKKEFLKREEIKTMQKEIAKLREIEAQKERERIAEIKAGEKFKKPPIPQIIPEGQPPVPPAAAKKAPPEAPPLGTLIPRLISRKPSPLTKILVRAGFLLLCLFLVGFSYWFFEVRKPKVMEITPPVEEITPPAEETPVKPEITIPPPLILVGETKTPEISKNEEIPGVLKQLMNEDLPAGVFTRVAIKDTSQNRLASLEDFSQAFQIEVPEGFFQKLESDFTLAIYAQKEGKRVVLSAKVKDQKGLSELLKNWETKISKEGVSVSGSKIPSLTSSFKTATFQGVPFRYLTISKQDFGICYAVSDDYFVLTTSFESFQKIIGELKSLTLEKNIGQLFIVGFEGKILTPQLEDFFKKYRPGGVLLLSKNIENKEQLKSLISGLQALALQETGLPLFIAVDQEGGTISPIDFLEETTAQSEIKNIEEAYQVGLKRGQELKELGVNLNLAPLLDFDLPATPEEKDFIFERSFQKSPLDIGNFSKALAAGQEAAGILTVIKHFPGYGGITPNPEEELATLETTPEISQFKKALEGNPEMVMTSDVIYNDIDSSLPFTFSPKGIQFLKNNLGPKILVLSDDLDQNSLLNKFPLKEIMTRPIEAGVDILIFSGYRLPVEQGLDEFFTAAKQKEVSETKIQEAISRITQLKQRLSK